jgi:uncharacterized protein with NRDE domain
MCLVALAIDQSRRFPLVVAANRDEFFARPAARLAWWSPRPDAASVLGGRDLESGGTWMGLTAAGRLALLTNLRGGLLNDPAAPSRGGIVTEWLCAQEPAHKFWMRTALSGHNGFNLIAADFREGECFWASNAGAHPKRLERGIYGLSNGGLDTPWPKVVALKSQLAAAMDAASSVDELAAQLFAALADRSLAADAELPQTGIPLDWERQLSAAFIRTPDQRYGTRCSTLIITERSGRHPVTHVFERSFNASGAVALLRRASLRHWPPRYSEGSLEGGVEEALVSESELAPAAESATLRKRTRVRSLLKPTQGRRKRTAGAMA